MFLKSTLQLNYQQSLAWIPMSALIEDKNSLLIKADAAVAFVRKEEVVLEKPSNRLQETLKHIPLMPAILGRTTDISRQAIDLAKFEGANGVGLNDAMLGLHGLGLGLSAFNLIALPLVYAMCRLRGLDCPYKYTDAAKWIYSGFAVALGVVAFAFPPSAPFIGVGLACASFAFSLFFLGKTALDYFMLRQRLKKTNEKLALLEAEEMQLIAEIQQQQARIKDNKAETDEQKAELEVDMRALDNNLKKLETNRQSWDMAKKDQRVIQQEMKNLNFMKVLDRGVGFGLASLALAGVIISLFFPLPGIIIISAAGGAGTLYAIGRFGIPLALKLGGWLYTTSSDLSAKSSKVEPVQESTLVIEAHITNSPAQTKKALEAIAEHQDDSALKDTDSAPNIVPVAPLGLKDNIQQDSPPSHDCKGVSH